VVDANVVLRAFRSRNGASFLILRRMLTGELPFAVSPAVALEYEDVVMRPGLLGPNPTVSRQEIEQVLDAVFAKAVLVSPWFRFRPFLNDPKDDLYVECALAAGAGTIITDDRHFQHPAVSAFGLTAIKARDFVAHNYQGKSK
jgi:predicted nucleic acid-binding protein